MPEQAPATLEQLDVKVTSSESRAVPFHISGACGTPTGGAVVLVVNAGDWNRAIKKRPDAHGFGVWVFDRPQVEVFKYDGSLQCGLGREISLESIANELKEKSIEVKASRKGNDGRMRIAMCGASTGGLNVYTIDTGELAKARELGFELLVTRQLSQEINASANARLRGPSLMRSPSRNPSEAGQRGIPQLW